MKDRGILELLTVLDSSNLQVGSSPQSASLDIHCWEHKLIQDSNPHFQFEAFRFQSNHWTISRVRTRHVLVTGWSSCCQLWSWAGGRIARTPGRQKGAFLFPVKNMTPREWKRDRRSGCQRRWLGSWINWYQDCVTYFVLVLYLYYHWFDSGIRPRQSGSLAHMPCWIDFYIWIPTVQGTFGYVLHIVMNLYRM